MALFLLSREKMDYATWIFNKRDKRASINENVSGMNSVHSQR